MVMGMEEHIVFHLNSCLLFGQIRKGIPLNSTDSVKERRSLGQKKKEHLSGHQKTLLLVTAFFPLWIYDLGSATSFLEALVFSVFWTLWEREKVGRFGRMALKYV